MGKFLHEETLLDGVSSTGAGEWRALAGLTDPTAVIEGIVAGDEVDLEVSNHPGIRETIPASSVATLGSTITEDGTRDIEEGYKWIRANLSAAAGGGDVTVRLTALEYA